MSTDRPSGYPGGAKREMTTAWKRAVDQKLLDAGKTRAWLAEELGVDKGAITRMLSDEQQTSSMVDDVCKLLDLPPPTLPISSFDEKNVVEGWRKLNEEDRDQVRRLIDRLRPRDRS